LSDRKPLVCGVWLLAVGLWAATGWLHAQGTAGAGALESAFFDGVAHEAIGYWRHPTGDPVARLAAALAAGTARLDYEDGAGYLRPLLRALDVNADTQLAVFSKTSLQSDIIDPQHPRLIYFNDSVAVAVPSGGFIEIAAQSPTQGVAFYSLRQDRAAPPRFVRSPQCLTCHVSYATLNVPGTLVRSVATAADGTSLPFLANATVDHRTPFKERWAGWFVTGATAGVPHLGNVTVPGAARTSAAATPAVTPLDTLARRVDSSRYLSPFSDVAVHLVFAHQMHMMNLITRVGWQTRVAENDHAADAARLRAAAAVEFVDYLLFIDEPRLPAPVHGASGFAERFSALGPRDRQGRSLRELDLRRRVLKYPCSYLIYSPAFDALPAEAKSAIYARMSAILTGKIAGERYRRLTAADRLAVLEILRDTKPDFAPFVAAPSSESR
jgi:hypothetical protein